MSEWIQNYYFLLSALMGGLCVYEAHLLLKLDGVWMNAKQLIWTSSIEFLWLILVCLGLFSWHFGGGQMLSGLLFFSHYLLSCIYTGYWFSASKNRESPEDWKLPRWYLEYYFSFGAIYAAINLILFWRDL